MSETETDHSRIYLVPNDRQALELMPESYRTSEVFLQTGMVCG